MVDTGPFIVKNLSEMISLQCPWCWHLLSTVKFAQFNSFTDAVHVGHQTDLYWHVQQLFKHGWFVTDDYFIILFSDSFTFSMHLLPYFQQTCVQSPSRLAVTCRFFAFFVRSGLLNIYRLIQFRVKFEANVFKSIKVWSKFLRWLVEHLKFECFIKCSEIPSDLI